MSDATTETPDAAAAAAAAAAAGASTESGASTDTSAASATVSGGAGEDVLRPEKLPETLWDATAKAPKWDDVATRLARADELEAAETARKEGVPAKPEDYKLDVSGDPILGLDGQPAAIDPANPLATGVLAVAHKHGLPQAVISDLARTFVETEVKAEKGVKEALDAEVAKLGEKARDRVTAVQGFIKQHCGSNADAAIAGLGSAGAVQAWEAVMSKITGATVTAIPGQDAKPKGLTETWFPSMNKTKAA